VAGVALITGATGFAGGHLLDRYVSRGERVHAWGHRGSDRRGIDGARVEWDAVDLLDRESVRDALRRVRPSLIYHCAGAAHVLTAWQTPAHALRVNVLGTHNLLEAARDVGLTCRVLVTGSALIYAPQADALTEDSPIGGATPYGVSKLAQEMVAAESGLPTLLVRPFNHAGPRQLPSFATSAFAQQIAEIESGRRDAVLHVGNLDARRDITDVRDMVRAYEALAEHGRPGVPYNVCSGSAHSMRALLDILLSLSTVRVRIDVDPSRLRPSDNPVILGSHARLTADTGWTPQIPIEQTLADLLDDWRVRVARAS
jgi:GDP-4-dehydro-6-deoxy-D-mannose reductase